MSCLRPALPKSPTYGVWGHSTMCFKAETICCTATDSRYARDALLLIPLSNSCTCFKALGKRHPLLWEAFSDFSLPWKQLACASNGPFLAVWVSFLVQLSP